MSNMHSKESLAITLCSVVNKDMSWNLFVHGNEVNTDECDAIPIPNILSDIHLEELVSRKNLYPHLTSAPYAPVIQTTNLLTWLNPKKESCFQKVVLML